MNRALATSRVLRAMLFAAVGAVLVAAPARGQGPLTLEAAIQRAAARHPTVEGARYATEEARARAGEAGAARFPSLSFDTKWTQFEEQMLVTPIHAFRPTELPPFDRTLIQSGLRLNYTLFDGGAEILARIELARVTGELDTAWISQSLVAAR
jgi:outer membrane protein TolC